MKLNSRSRSTYYNYARSIAKISLHFKQTPLQLSLEEIEDYLLLQKQSWQPSESYFKDMVYGLRFLFRLYDRPAVKVSPLLPKQPHIRRCPICKKGQMVILGFGNGRDPPPDINRLNKFIYPPPTIATVA